MTKPTARQVWRQLVDEAGEDEIAAILSLTQEQVDAELAGVAGFDARKEQAAADAFLDDLASGALEAGMGLTAAPAHVPEEPPSSGVVAVAQPPEQPPEPSPAPSFNPKPDLVAAADWRRKATAACDAKKWEECLANLDIARAIDPDGDETPAVKATRAKAIKGVLDKPPTPDKPPVP